MLSENAISFLANLTYREDAVREINLIPLSGIYWEDEFPMFGDAAELLSEQDRCEIISLFCIRAALWRGHTLTEDEQKRWDDARTRVPQWALFHRLEVTDDDLRADDFAMKTMDDFEAQMIAEADEVDRKEDGGFQAKFTVKQETDENEKQDESDGKPRIQ